MFASVSSQPRSSFSYIFYDQFRIIVSQMTMSVGLCLLSVTIISTFVLAHPLLVLSVVLALTLVFVDLLGNIVLWDLDLNTISMINLVMAVGLVVDTWAGLACFNTSQLVWFIKCVCIMSELWSKLLVRVM